MSVVVKIYIFKMNRMSSTRKWPQGRYDADHVDRSADKTLVLLFWSFFGLMISAGLKGVNGPHCPCPTVFGGFLGIK